MKRTLFVCIILLLACRSFSQSIVVTASANPLCPGSTVTLTPGSFSYSGYYYYQWQQEVGGVYTNVPAYMEFNGVLTATPNVTTNYRLELLDYYSSALITSSVTTILVYAVTPPIIYGKTFTCSKADTLYTTYTSGYSYEWSMKNQFGSLITSTGTTFFDFDTLGNPSMGYSNLGIVDSVYLTSTDNNGCKATSMFLDTMSISYMVYPFDTAASHLCSGNPFTVSIPSNRFASSYSIAEEIYNYTTASYIYIPEI